MLYDGEFVREVLQGVLLVFMGCRLAAKEKGESFDSPFFSFPKSAT